MTRFMMSLDDSVDLVLYAFAARPAGRHLRAEGARVRPSRSWPQAIKRPVRPADTPCAIIGTRHGEKLYESLLSREEMARAEDMGRYYRIPADNRDLNYATVLHAKAPAQISESDDYTSHNTERLDVEQIKELLLKLDYVREQLR